jgi:hypothetical protein
MTLGEGPCRDAAAGAPVLAGDLSDAGAGRRWPAFSPSACDLGVQAIFVLPLMIGAIRAGVLGMYRDAMGASASASKCRGHSPYCATTPATATSG